MTEPKYTIGQRIYHLWVGPTIYEAIINEVSMLEEGPHYRLSTADYTLFPECDIYPTEEAAIKAAINLIEIKRL